MSLITGGACTFSKRPDQFINGVYSKTWSPTMEREFIDTVNGLGANTFGRKGMYSLPSALEAECAQILCERTGMDAARFTCNGGDATEAAVRYARAKTHKEEIWYTGYHGSGFWWSSATPPATGCVQCGFRKFDTMELLIDSIAFISKAHNIAAVVVEPVELDTETGSILRELKSLCKHFGIALIFDEIITGGRVPEFCVSNWRNVKPDMICFGKGLGGGYPFSALVGTAEYMSNESVFVSYTFAGFEPALKECIKIASLSNTQISSWYHRCMKFKNDFNTIGKGTVILFGYPTRSTWKGKDKDIWLFMQEMYKRNIFIGKVWFPSYRWKKEVYDEILIQAKEVITGIKTGKFELEGAPPVQLFKRV